MNDGMPTSPTKEEEAGWLMVAYTASRRHLPQFMLSAIDSFGEVLKPAVNHLAIASAPIRKVLASTVAGAVDALEKLDYSGKVRFYATTIVGWLAHNTNFPAFIAYLRASYAHEWTEYLQERAVFLYARLKAISRIDDVLYISAYLLSEGSQKVHDALISAWNSSPAFLHKSMEALLGGGPLSKLLREKARIFSSLVSMKTEIVSRASTLRKSGKKLVRKAKDIAQRTVFVLCYTADAAFNKSLRVVDERVVSWISSPPRDVNLRGEDRLLDMEARLRSELTQFLAAKKRAVATSRVYTSVHDRITSALVVLRDASKRTKEAIASAEWPETIKSPIGSILVFVGMGSILKLFDETVWHRLDRDNDGVITLRDLFQTFSPSFVLQALLASYSSALASRHKHRSE